MGWRERDYAKFTDEERRILYGDFRRPADGGPLRALPAGGSGGVGARRHAGSTASPAPHIGLGRGLLRALGLLGIAVVASAVILGGMILTGTVPDLRQQPDTHGSLIAGPFHVIAAPPPIITVPTPQPTNVIGIRWRATDLVPAANAGRICVTDSKYGRICAGYVGGERPADVLARELAARGVRVQSSG